MAEAGQVIDHPSLGVRFRFLQTAEETDGNLLQVELTLPPGFSISEHVHPQQEERHRVISGTLRARVGGYQRDYGAGEQVVGPAGVPHAWRNPSDRENLRIVSEHRPVLHMQLLLEAGSAIARDFVTNKKAAFKHLLRMAILMDEIKADFYFTGFVMRLVMWLFVRLAPIGRFLGYGANSTTSASKQHESTS